MVKFFDYFFRKNNKKIRIRKIRKKFSKKMIIGIIKFNFERMVDIFKKKNPFWRG